MVGDLQKPKSEVYQRNSITDCFNNNFDDQLAKLAKKTQIGSYNTAQDYVEVLEACFALFKTIYQVDLETGAPRFRKEKKVLLKRSFDFFGWRWSGQECQYQATPMTCFWKLLLLNI